MEKKIKNERTKEEFILNEFIKDELILDSEYFLKANIMYPDSKLRNQDFRVRMHKSLDYAKEPSLIEILLPISSNSLYYALPFCNEITSLGDYYNISGVYVFYGYSSDSTPQVLYVGESNDIWGRIVEHISGNSNLKKVVFDENIYEPFKYIRWVEIYNLDATNFIHRKLLEQAMIAVKKPLHNNFREKRAYSADIKYRDYLLREKEVTKEISITWSKKTWDLKALSYEYYKEKHNLIREKKPVKDMSKFEEFLHSEKDKYSDSKWSIKIENI